jgi:hypothetical protein
MSEGADTETFGFSFPFSATWLQGCYELDLSPFLLRRLAGCEHSITRSAGASVQGRPQDQTALTCLDGAR